MTRKELRSFVKDKLKAEGFISQNRYLYKIIDEDYLIGIHLDPSTYCKGYGLVCGVIYLPDELKFPLCGRYDLQWTFCFPRNVGQKLDLTKYEDDTSLTTVFEYENHSVEQFEEYFELNYERFIVPLFNKEFGLEMFRKDWRLMNRFSVQTVNKLCQRASLDTQTVLKYLGKMPHKA